MRRFLLFLKSPYCNKSEVMVSLFGYLRGFYPDFKAEKIKKENTYKRLKDEVVTDANRTKARKYVNDRISDLTVLLEEFLVMQSIINNPEKKAELLREKFLKLRENDFFLKANAQAIDTLDKKTILSGEEQLALWKLKYEPFLHPQFNHLSAKNSDISDTMPDLDTAYAIFKLRYEVHRLCHRRILKSKDEKLPLLEGIVATFSDTDNVVIRIYLEILSCFENEAIARWKKTVAEVVRHFPELPFEEKLVMLTALINLGYRLAQGISRGMFLEIFQLYRLGSDDGLWTHGGIISRITFMNIVIMGTTTIGGLKPNEVREQLRWIELFIEKARDYLPENNRRNTIILARAQLAFAKRDFERTCSLLQEVKLSELPDKLQFRVLQAKCLYELNGQHPVNEERLLNFLNAFYRFIKEKPLAEEKKQAYINFIKTLRNLSDGNSTPQRRKRLRRRLTNKEGMVARDWLGEKLSEYDA